MESGFLRAGRFQGQSERYAFRPSHVLVGRQPAVRLETVLGDAIIERHVSW